MVSIFGKILGDPSQRAVKKYWHPVELINSFEEEFEPLSDQQLQAKMGELKERLERGEKLEDLLPECFAAVREAAKRTLGQRHYDVQLIGGIVLHEGKIAEMKTGEGKTLVATLPVCLNALTGRGVHVVTVNDYLAKRDTVWMGPIYHALGLSVCCLQHDAAYMYDPTAETEDPSLNYLRPTTRREAYQADITYGTNNEFGFDYLRDNMAPDLSMLVQRDYHYAIVDEVDNILIDEARTPLIISGPAEEPVQSYFTFARLAPRLRAEEDYTIDERTRAISMTQPGISKMEQWTKVGNLYAPENFHLVHYIENALAAHVLRKRDRDYVVRDGQVVIVDEFTGRLQPGRRWSDGLHQAVEAKESLKVQRESITYATITLQNYFRMYGKLAGMTGTAATESEEFFKIYRLDVIVIPTNRPLIRHELSDLIYKNEEAKWRAVAQEIQELNKIGRPMLVGTTSIENSERLSALLNKVGVSHQVLNAKQHEHEAGIIAQAGRRGAVTVATNMAGRGTDIILGGTPPDSSSNSDWNWEEEHNFVISVGGLHVIGTEHHEARRIDNQLRGRSGRQGDPGSSHFYASLDDDLLKRFGGDRIKSIMNWVGMDEDTAIENRIVTRSVGASQVKVEGYNFEIRKHLLEYDDVLNKQREVIYGERYKMLSGADLRSNTLSMIHKEAESLLYHYLPSTDPETWDAKGLLEELLIFIPLPSEISNEERMHRRSRDEIEEQLTSYIEDLYQQREQQMGPENMRTLERLLMLRAIDSHWVHHLTTMENLRTGIGLHAVGQRDPLVMYKSEGHRLFQELLDRIQRDIVHTIYHVSLSPTNGARRTGSKPEESPMAAVAGEPREAVPVGARKVGRNEACPCGSGKKFKRCHGASV